MERDTVAIYDERGADWAARRMPVRRDAARRFGRSVAAGRLRADLGCGSGRYLGDMGAPVLGIDASATMLALARAEHGDRALLVQADLEAVPLGRRALAGAWANMSYLHVPRVRLPLALADLHRSLDVGAPLDLQVLAGDHEGPDLPGDDIGGRFFAAWSPDALHHVLVGAGFHVEHVEVEDDVVRVRAVRARSLPDTVGPGMRVLMCGLNPSLFAADAGVAFARPGNRFWKAVVAAGLASRPRDPVHALSAHGLGMTDLVKRATVRSAELSAAEYRAGAERVSWLAGWLQPGAVCFVGLEGWRAAVDRRAVAGWQPHGVAGVPAYVMPSTSGLNAHASLDVLVEHLSAVLAGP